MKIYEVNFNDHFVQMFSSKEQVIKGIYLWAKRCHYENFKIEENWLTYFYQTFEVNDIVLDGTAKEFDENKKTWSKIHFFIAINDFTLDGYNQTDEDLMLSSKIKRFFNL